MPAEIAVLNLALTGFFFFLLLFGLRRPFIWVLAYIYVDILAPQRLAYGMLSSLPASLIVFVLAVGGWAMQMRRAGNPPGARQGLILLLLAWCAFTTHFADFPAAAAEKWDWVWKALLFAAFLPLTLATRLRIEATALVMVLTAGAIVIDGAIKTLGGGGGYGELHLFLADNTGLYEGSTLSCVAVAIIPLILWLARFGTIFPPDGRVRLFAAGLIFACLLIPVGTAARTGLVCAGLLGAMMLRSVKRRGLYLALAAIVLAIAVPLLPATYTKRMDTLGHAGSDESAATRLAVWAWTLDYARDHPFGGGFNAYLADKIHLRLTSTDSGSSAASAQTTDAYDHARAYHSAYFEMLGEQGWPGLALWLTLQLSGLVQLQRVRRSLRGSGDTRDRADAALATALQEGQVVYMLGAGFTGIAYQPFVYMLIGLQIALARQVRLRLANSGRRPSPDGFQKPFGILEQAPAGTAARVEP